MVPQEETGCAAHSLSGSVPGPTKEQVPTDPALLQRWQRPLHTLPQQTPSVQKPELHWLPVTQTTPFGFFGKHDPAEQ